MKLALTLFFPVLILVSPFCQAETIVSEDIQLLQQSVNIDALDRFNIDDKIDEPPVQQSAPHMTTLPDSHKLDVQQRLSRLESHMQADHDEDGYAIVDGDCDDNDPFTYPNAYEARDGVDNDCDGLVDNPL